jgi:diacylglycerol kinase
MLVANERAISKREHAMRHLVPLALVLLLMSAIVTPAWARTVVIESTVPLADDSEETLRSAIKKAIENAVRGAAALGLRAMQVNGAQVFSNALMLRLIATDDDPGDDDPDDGEAETII